MSQSGLRQRIGIVIIGQFKGSSARLDRSVEVGRRQLEIRLLQQLVAGERLLGPLVDRPGHQIQGPRHIAALGNQGSAEPVVQRRQVALIGADLNRLLEMLDNARPELARLHGGAGKGLAIVGGAGEEMDLRRALAEAMHLQQDRLGKRDQPGWVLIGMESLPQLGDGGVKLPPFERVANRGAGGNGEEGQQSHHERRHLPQLPRSEPRAPDPAAPRRLFCRAHRLPSPVSPPPRRHPPPGAWLLANGRRPVKCRPPGRVRSVRLQAVRHMRPAEAGHDKRMPIAAILLWTNCPPSPIRRPPNSTHGGRSNAGHPGLGLRA